MTTYGAYNAGLPCKNPSCKSHGKPHPNCRCYGEGMAKGGEAESFCSKDRPHNNDCQYYDDGGAVAPTPQPTEDIPTPEPESAPPSFEDLSEPEAAATPRFEDLSEPEAEANPSFDDLVPAEQYETPLQIGATAAEGAAQGAVGPAAPLIAMGENELSKLGVPGTSYEEQAHRATINPGTHLAGQTAGVVLGFGKVAKALEATKLIKMAGTVGSGLISNAITAGLISGGDEATKAMLGVGDPNETFWGHALNVGANMLISGGLGGAVNQAQAMKLGTKIVDFSKGVGSAANPEAFAPVITDMQRYLGSVSGANQIENEVLALVKAESPGNSAAFNYGQKAYKMLSLPNIGSAIGGAIGYHHSGVLGAIEGALAGRGGGAIGALGTKYLAPTAAKIMSMAPEGTDIAGMVQDGLNFNTSAASGISKANKVIDAVMKGAAIKAVDNKPYLKKQLDDYFGNGGINYNLQQDQQNQDASPIGMATGGEVPARIEGRGILSENEGLARLYPAQNILLNATKGRISNYMTALRPPKNAPHLPYDDKPDYGDKKKSYDKAMDIAINPLSVMRHIQQGTIDNDHIQHLTAMYPEVKDAMQKLVTKKITEQQMAKEKPPLHIRDGLSLFLGAPLGSEMMPQNIRAAQAALQLSNAKSQVQDQPQPTAGKTSKAPLSKVSQGMQTTQQSLVTRQQRAR